MKTKLTAWQKWMTVIVVATLVVAMQPQRLQAAAICSDSCIQVYEDAVMAVAVTKVQCDAAVYQLGLWHQAQKFRDQLLCDVEYLSDLTQVTMEYANCMSIRALLFGKVEDPQQ